MHDPDDFADMVVMTVKAALSPVLERLAAVEAQHTMLRATAQAGGDLRDRIVVLETKSAVPVSVDTDLRERVLAFAPLPERLAAAETQLVTLQGVVSELRSQLAESKSFTPTVDTSLYERVAVTEARLSAQPAPDPAIAEIRDLMRMLETKVAETEPIDLITVEADLDECRDRLLRLETTPPVTDHAIHERVRALETAPPHVDQDVRARVAELTALPERVVTLETKLAMTPDSDKAITELRERVVTLETKSDFHVEPETDAKDHVVAAVAPVQERVASVEARLDVIVDTQKAVDAMRERVVTLETKAATVPQPVLDTDIRERVGALEFKVNSISNDDAVARLEKRIDTVESIQKELPALRERLAVAEVRTGTPGPAGKDGKDGKDGAPGADGLGFDDLAVVQQNERSFTVRAFRGDRSKDIGTVSFPVELYRGVWVERTYEPGDSVTWAGSEWHCNEQTATKPGTDSRAWTLKVKRGRDGKDGRDAVDVRPVHIT